MSTRIYEQLSSLYKEHRDTPQQPIVELWLKTLEGPAFDLPTGATLTYEFPHDDFAECDVTRMPANCATVTIWELS